MAPQDFGCFNHDLLIGNRLGGTIAAFDAVGGKFLGNLLDANEAPIAIDGLCALEFDNRGTKETGTTAIPLTGPATCSKSVPGEEGGAAASTWSVDKRQPLATAAP